MNENFKGGLNNVMTSYNDPVDSRYHQRCVDNRHWSWIRASECGKPIWEEGRFGCLDTSVDDADWSDECTVVLSPVGDIRMEYMGSPESARLLSRSPEYWLEHMGRDRAVAAALRLHHDASLIMTNVQVMSQFVTSLNRTASEVMCTVYTREPFPTDAVHFVTPGRRVRHAAHYMAAMGMWRPTSAPVFPGPIPVSSCNSCMACEDCFPETYIRTLNIVYVIFG